MADIELVIRIPEEMKEEIDNGIIHYDNRLNRAIINGTPLPEGHDRLIDHKYVVNAIDDWVNAGECHYSNALYYLKKRIANIPTIIETDKGGEQ